jgi:pseudaminic acid synthase
MDSVSINNHRIGSDAPVYVVAELSANHNQSLERAVELIHVAAECGANAVKIQTYTADTLTIDADSDDFKIFPGSTWEGKTLYQLYREAYTPWEWHAELVAKARQYRIALFSSPFDSTAVDFLEQLDMPAYKIASFELVDIPLLRRVAQIGKPVILSTGMASKQEIHEAVHTLRTHGARQIVLLKCTSSYPASFEEMHLNTISDMRREFALNIGLSDHTMGFIAATSAVALGACMIEKHLTLRRSDGGPDSSFSMEPDEFRQMVAYVRQVERSLGNCVYGGSGDERKNLVFRRSVYAVQDIKEGERFTPENIRSIRPAHGLHPRYLDSILGRKAKRSLRRGTPLSWGAVDSTLCLRDANASDRDLLLAWRNDPDTRRNSHSTAPVPPEEHEQWLSKTLGTPSRRLFIAEDSGVPVGSVRADLAADHSELSWTVAPEARNKGFGKKMVLIAAQKIGGRIKAQVKEGNEASVAIVKSIGLHLEEVRDGVLYFSGYISRAE